MDSNRKPLQFPVTDEIGYRGGWNATLWRRLLSLHIAINIPLFPLSRTASRTRWHHNLHCPSSSCTISSSRVMWVPECRYVCEAASPERVLNDFISRFPRSCAFSKYILSLENSYAESRTPKPRMVVSKVDEGPLCTAMKHVNEAISIAYVEKATK